MRNAQRYLRACDQTTQLSAALSTRAVIDQVKGILMAVRRISAVEAFDALVEHPPTRAVPSGGGTR